MHKVIDWLTITFYWCETQYVRFRKEHRLRVFENRVLREIFGPNRKEVTGARKKVLNEELHNLWDRTIVFRPIHALELHIRIFSRAWVDVGYDFEVTRKHGMLKYCYITHGSVVWSMQSFISQHPCFSWIATHF
jgi:hypothetical protein